MREQINLQVWRDLGLNKPAMEGLKDSPGNDDGEDAIVWDIVLRDCKGQTLNKGNGDATLRISIGFHSSSLKLHLE